MIKAVYFDLDGIYFNRGLDEFLKHFSHLYSIPVHTLEAVFKRSKEAHDYKAGLISSGKFFEAVVRATGIKVPENEYFEEIVSCYHLSEEAKMLNSKLREQGIKTCLCANAFKDVILWLDHKYSFLDTFDVSIFSYDVHALKPEIFVFEALLEELELNASEILYVDDDAKSCEKARSLGFHSFCSDQISFLKSKLSEFGVEV